MTLDQALSKIRCAWIIGLISAAVTFVIMLVAISHGGTFNLEGTTVGVGILLDVLLTLLLTFGIYMKSRVATIGMFIYFLVSKITQVAAGFNAVGAAIGIVLLYFFFEGARGAITYHRLRHSDI